MPYSPAEVPKPNRAPLDELTLRGRRQHQHQAAMGAAARSQSTYLLV